ncbi:MAG: hypothetical protein C4547_00495 [Phycisphaerales bacterium]|nr:MAG: hypothetical protein C4547_00495 [Phycisphaerales bacterium]
MKLEAVIASRWAVVGTSALLLIGILAFLRIVTNAVAVINIRDGRIRAALARKAKRLAEAGLEHDSSGDGAVDALRRAS